MTGEEFMLILNAVVGRDGYHLQTRLQGKDGWKKAQERFSAVDRYEYLNAHLQSEALGYSKT